MNTRKSLVLMLAAAVVLSAGCNVAAELPAVEREQLIGTWVSIDGAELIFAESGRFSAENIPPNSGIGERSRPFSDRGKWKFHDPAPLSPARIELSFESQSFSAVVFAQGRGRSLRVYYIKGDPDDHNHYNFKKKG